MLHVPIGANTFNNPVPSWGTTRPAAANGVSITPSAGSYGSYAQVGSDLTEDCYGLLININSNYGSAASRNTVVTIGIDEAGGTSFTDRIPDLICAGAGTYIMPGSGVWYYFPIFIPSGAAVGAKANSSVTTAIRVGLVFLTHPANPSMTRKGSFVNAIGITGNNGTSVTPGTSSEGSWTSLGSTSNRLWWWQLGVQLVTTDTSWAANALHIDLATGDATNKDIIIEDLCITTTTGEQLAMPPFTQGVEWEVPSGGNIYVRAQNSGTNDAGYYIAAYGLGIT